KRYNLHDPVMPDLSGDQPPDSVINKPFTPQPVNPQRTCAVEQGISGIEPLDSPDLPTVRDYGAQPQYKTQAVPNRSN
ncbi:MAG TPA: hypothetical protein VFL85_02610, partial [Candidatus Saccharimonadales bacterium]|nr:hypothetical protein [Candidatus Saccharimonadales bacterium]